jgi:mono/diheme cytochrome c family protein/cytochrome c553
VKKTALFVAITALLAASALARTPVSVAPTPAADTAGFEARVLPLLKANCFTCHSGAGRSGGLDLTTRAGLLKGGASGAAVSPAQPESSLLLRAVHYDGRQMPPSGKLSPAQIAILAAWVAKGAPYSAAAVAAVAPSGHLVPPPVNAQTMHFWSFQMPRRPHVPKVSNPGWVRSPIDAFILVKLEKRGLTPAPEASRATLIRRAYYDMTGLPPAPAEVRAFLADRSPRAYETVVDRLLASPQYGERWGRHYLDLVRYAETNSFERDSDKPFVWRYRDYVIRSFNADKPYDQFVREQIAGDELPVASPDALVATGYYRLGAWDDAPADPEQARADELDDICSTTAQTFLGLTVGCARCHDHKIDPIPQKDYYRMVSFFQNIQSYSAKALRPIGSPDQQRGYAGAMAAYNAKIADLGRRIDAVEARVRTDFADVENEDFKNEQNQIPLIGKRVGRLISAADFAGYVALKGQLAALKTQPPTGDEQALSVAERGPVAPPTFVLARGNAHAPGDEVRPAFLSVLAPPAPEIRPVGTVSTGRRLALARWLVSDQNPLAARVIANRVWQFHFGRGIVRSASNFGFQGVPPTHPELLDYLATELIRNGWHLKPLHREILLSSAYRMSSRANPKALAKDPENDLFQHFDMRRLDAEEVRDSILAANGSLNPKMYGPSVLVTLPREVLLGQSVPGSGWGESPAAEQARRSVYIKVKRTLAVPILAAFDGADMDNTCPVRFATTQPTQALEMMNSAFVQRQAAVFADFIRRSVGPSAPERQVRFVLFRVLQREPTPVEVARGVALMNALETQDGKSPDEALRCFCLVALNLNEFVYLD